VRIRSIRVNLRRWTRYQRWGQEGNNARVYRTCRRLGPVAVCADDWRKHALWLGDARHRGLRYIDDRRVAA
jgi:hypothetical protein